MQAFKSSSAVLRAPARAGPAVLLGFYRPPLNSREGVVGEVLADILSGGRTSRLVSELVLSRRLLSASVVAGYPGEKRAGLMLVYGVPAQGAQGTLWYHGIMASWHHGIMVLRYHGITVFWYGPVMGPAVLQPCLLPCAAHLS